MTTNVDIVTTYGATGDYQQITAVISITSTSTDLTVAGNNFVGGDVGKNIAIIGAGTVDASNNPLGALNTTISVVGSFSGGVQHITLADPATHTVTAANKVVGWGHDDAPAFAAAGVALQGLSDVVLTLPSGRNFFFASLAANTWLYGVKQIVVSGYGATLSDPTEMFFPFMGGQGIIQDGTHSSLVATASASSNVVQLITPAENSRFAANQWVMLSAIDLQGAFSYPPNPGTFEFLQISAINSTTGVVTFTSRLRYTYKSTYPNYNPAVASDAWVGGPATLYSLPDSWNIDVAYQGITFNVPRGIGVALGRKIAFKDCVLTGTEGIGPTQVLDWQTDNLVQASASVELDKLGFTCLIQRGSSHQLKNQSRASADTLTVYNHTTDDLIGTPRSMFSNGSTYATFRVGPTGYGCSDQLTLNRDVISSLLLSSALDPIADSTYTMANGILTRPLSDDAASWAIPGKYYYFGIANYRFAVPFIVTDIATDGTNVFIHTNLTGGFPLAGSPILISSHPMLSATITSVTGCADVVDLSANQIPNTPLFQRSKRFYGGAVQIPPIFTIFGPLVSLKINVITPYAGVLSLVGEIGDNGVNIMNGSSPTTYDPLVNLKAAGERVITPGSVTGAQSGDTLGSAPGAISFAESIGMKLSRDISGEGSALSFSIELITNQGIIITEGASWRLGGAAI